MGRFEKLCQELFGPASQGAFALNGLHILQNGFHKGGGVERVYTAPRAEKAACSGLALEGISKVYPGGVRAIAELNLNVQEELLVLVGPSGSGKTTTLRLIAGLEAPTEGQIRIAGRDVTFLPPWRREVALVAQEMALYPHWTVSRNLSFGLELKGGIAARGLKRLWSYWNKWSVAAAQRDALDQETLDQETLDKQVREVAALLQIEQLLGAFPHELSGGERQRVALGRAVVRRPRVFLLDEPLAHLDVRMRERARQLIRDLQRRLRAVMVYVTHDQSEALALGDRVAVMQDGQIRQIGTPREVYELPADRFVAEFLGSQPMNLLSGYLEMTGGRASLVGKGVRLPLPGLPWGVSPGVKVTLGFRPEHVTPSVRAGSAEQQQPISDDGRLDDGRLVAAVVEREWLGDSVLTRFVAGDWLLTARWRPESPCEGRPLAPGESCELQILAARMHWFEEPSGRRLSSSSSTTLQRDVAGVDVAGTNIAGPDVLVRK